MRRHFRRTGHDASFFIPGARKKQSFLGLGLTERTHYDGHVSRNLSSMRADNSFEGRQVHHRRSCVFFLVIGVFRALLSASHRQTWMADGSSRSWLLSGEGKKLLKDLSGSLLVMEFVLIFSFPFMERSRGKTSSKSFIE